MTEPHHVFKIFNVSPESKLSNRIIHVKSSEFEDNVDDDEDVANIQIQQVVIQSSESESSDDLEEDDTTEKID